MKKFIGLVGTNSDNSTNRHLLHFMAKHYADTAEIEILEIDHLPLWNKPTDYSVLPEVQIMSDKIKESDGVIIATPEYDHAPTAALNNALAWLSYKTYPFVDMPVMIVGASYGTLGSSRSQIQLQQLLEAPEIKAHVMPSSEFLLAHSLEAFDADGNLVFDHKVKELDDIFTSFIQFVDIIEQLPNSREIGSETAAKYIYDTK